MPADIILNVESEKACQSFLKESLVNAHELGNEGLDVEDGFAAQLQSMLVVGRHLCNFCF